MKTRSRRYAAVWDREGKRMMHVHRVVAAQFVGRPLRPGEVVHHIDGDRANNAPENLAVLPSQRYHASLEGALRRLKRGQPPLFPELLRAGGVTA